MAAFSVPERPCSSYEQQNHYLTYITFEARNMKIDPYQLLNDIIRQAIANFEHEHSNLPRDELGRRWRRQWQRLNSFLNGSGLPASLRSLRRQQILQKPSRKNYSGCKRHAHRDRSVVPAITRTWYLSAARNVPSARLINSPKATEAWEPSLLGSSIIHPYVHLHADKIVWMMRNYCASYLESPRASFHREPQVHRFTTHAYFAHRIQKGIFDFLDGDMMAALSSFQSAFTLIKEIFRDHHPMSIAMIFSVLGELKKNDLQKVLAQLLSRMRKTVLMQFKSSHIANIFEILDVAGSDAPSLGVCGLRMAVDYFEKTCDSLSWKTLYLKERLCDCLYYEGMWGEGGALRRNLLEEQEMKYGKCARNVLWTLANVAEDELQRGRPWSAEKRFRDALERSEALEGYERANCRFKALEGLSKIVMIAAESVPQSEDVVDPGFANEDSKGIRKMMLLEALRRLIDAGKEAQTWFEPENPRTKRLNERISTCERMLRTADATAEPGAADPRRYGSGMKVHRDHGGCTTSVGINHELTHMADEHHHGVTPRLRADNNNCEREKNCDMGLYRHGLCEENDFIWQDSLEDPRVLEPGILVQDLEAPQRANGASLQTASTPEKHERQQVTPPMALSTQKLIAANENSTSTTAVTHKSFPHRDAPITSLGDSSIEFDDEQSFMHGTSGEDSLSTERSEQVNCLSERIMRSTLISFVRGTGNERPTASGSSSTDSSSRTHKQTSSSSSATAVSSSQSLNKRSYSSQDGPGNSDNPENDGNGKRTCRGPSRQSPEQNVLFACPFYRFDSNRYSPCNMDSQEMGYRGCSSAVLRDIPRLKQHLHRVHRRPDFYCGRCNIIFDTEDILDEHARMVPACETTELRFRERMSKTQMNAIKKRNVRMIGHAEWFKIYKILFPQAKRPPESHAYADFQSAAPVQDFLAHFQAVAPTLLLTFLGEELQGSVFSPQENSDIMNGALQRAVSRLILALRPTDVDPGLDGHPVQYVNDDDFLSQQLPAAEYTFDLEELCHGFDTEGLHERDMGLEGQ